MLEGLPAGAALGRRDRRTGGRPGGRARRQRPGRHGQVMGAARRSSPATPTWAWFPRPSNRRWRAEQSRHMMVPTRQLLRSIAADVCVAPSSSRMRWPIWPRSASRRGEQPPRLRGRPAADQRADARRRRGRRFATPGCRCSPPTSRPRRSRAWPRCSRTCRGRWSPSAAAARAPATALPGRHRALTGRLRRRARR